ncbi:MAG: SEC-C metal-binding domain-containing protein [Candidatus Helarchaeota archaeon]
MTEEKKPEKIKVLWLSDTPTCATGFGMVVKNLLKILNATGKYEFTIVGINHSDYYDQKEFPYKILEAAPALTSDPRYKDLFGRQRLLTELGTGKYDILFTLQDAFIMEEIADQIVQTRISMQESNKKLGRNHYKNFKWIYYFPIDAAPKENWITQSIIKADYPICYTNYGKEQCRQAYKQQGVFEKDGQPYVVDPLANMRIIYHGANLKDFYPIENKQELEAFKVDYFQKKANGKKIITNINRNQPRKDLPRTLMAFSKLLEQRNDIFLYLHCQANDAGGNIIEFARNFKNLKIGENWSVPSPKLFESNQGVPIDVLNKIYNISDVIMSTTWGEGWGLSYTEAFATKTILVAPRNTSIPEIIGEIDERGLSYNAGSTSSEFISVFMDNERIRPLGNVDDLIKKLNFALDNTYEVKQKIDAAYEWVQKYTWDGEYIGKKWIDVFDAAYIDLLKEKWGINNKIGRNEPCTCGSGRKYKHCCGK